MADTNATSDAGSRPETPPPAGLPDIWIDTHCHLDAAEFDVDRAAVIDRATRAGVAMIVIPAIMPSTFDACCQLAHATGGAYALGTHPLYVNAVSETEAIGALADALARRHTDPRLVAVGEIGLDLFVPGLRGADTLAKQERLYAAQLELAGQYGLPAILHVRRSADLLLKHLRRLHRAGRAPGGGIAHAFNGSVQQARSFIEMGFKLGFGGALTFERALQIRRLAAGLPDEAIVLETDAPDIPPHWLYETAQARAAGARSRNEPAELPRIAQTLASLRGWSVARTRRQTTANALAALPCLRALCV